MPPSNRKRFNAFDDFPDIESNQHAENPQKITVSNQQQPAVQVERIERLKPSQMMPDRFQPRRLLPSQVRSLFFSGKMNCYQAGIEWLTLAKQDAGYQAEIDRLLAMGSSFEEHGQIKAITGSWQPNNDGNFTFIIETGERRFWAACLRTVIDQLEEEPLLRVEVIASPTRQRQVIENRHAEPPSAVGQACEIAALILAELGIHPQSNTNDEFDYFRLARSQRMPTGLWEKVQPIMQLTRPRMVQLLNLLQFPTALLELADRYRLPERVLREILSLPRDQWERMLRLSIQNQLTSDDVADLTRPASELSTSSRNERTKPAKFEPGQAAFGGIRRFANSLIDLDEFSQAQALDEIADSIVVNQKVKEIQYLLIELNRLIEARISRK